MDRDPKTTVLLEKGHYPVLELMSPEIDYTEFLFLQSFTNLLEVVTEFIKVQGYTQSI